MKEVFITGHQNPDMDSLCSAYAYAALRNRLDPQRDYKAVRCGHLSNNVRRQLDLVGIETPPYMRDVFPQVRDVMLQSEGIEATDPIYGLIQTYTDAKPSVVPLFLKGEYYGLLSVDDITAWFLKDNSGRNPVYDFTTENIARVIPGEVLHQGTRTAFSAPIHAAAASYDAFCAYLDRDNGSVFVTGVMPEYIRYAMKKQVPAILLTAAEQAPEIDFSGYDGFVYRTPLGTAETIRRLRMAQPAMTLMGEQSEPLQASDLFEEAKDMFLSAHVRGFAVEENGQYIGYVTRRCFLKTPVNHVILVDHNEREQSIRGIESAEIEAIIDHHRLNAPETAYPIFIDTEPVGSTCTIVYYQYLKNGLVPDPLTAKAMLTGILTDTLHLKSPTATEKDAEAVKRLGELSGTDVPAYWQQLLSVTESLSSVDPGDAIRSDFKSYDANGTKFGISQYEVTTLRDVPEYEQQYLDRLETVRREMGLDWLVLMITDVLREHSILLSTEHKALRKLPYRKIHPRTFDMPTVLSRKKQLLPTLLHLLEG